MIVSSLANEGNAIAPALGVITRPVKRGSSARESYAKSTLNCFDFWMAAAIVAM